MLLKEVPLQWDLIRIAREFCAALRYTQDKQVAPTEYCQLNTEYWILITLTEVSDHLSTVLVLPAPPAWPARPAPAVQRRLLKLILPGQPLMF